MPAACALCLVGQEEKWQKGTHELIGLLEGRLTGAGEDPAREGFRVPALHAARQAEEDEEDEEEEEEDEEGRKSGRTVEGFLLATLLVASRKWQKAR